MTAASATMPPSPLLGRRERLWPTLALSLALHAAFVGLVVWKRAPAPIDLNQKPIVARLVKQGELRPKEFLPRKEAAPPPGPPAEPAPAPTPTPAPPPKAPPPPAAMPPPKAAPAKPQPTRAPAPARPAPARTTGGGGLAGVMSRIQQDEKTYGSPEGDPLGDSEVGEGDPYLALVTRSLQDTYVLPSTISEKERISLSATVVLFIDPDGSVSRYQFERRSGNPTFDGALERAIRTARLPPPPPEKRALFRSQGLAVVYRP